MADRVALIGDLLLPDRVEQEHSFGRWQMDERQKLYGDLKRYRALRNLKTDEPTIEVIEIMIGETEDRVVQLERVRRMMRLISKDTVARVLIAQGNQQRLHLAAVTLDD
jgi:hypothetical protein